MSYKSCKNLQFSSGISQFEIYASSKSWKENITIEKRAERNKERKILAILLLFLYEIECLRYVEAPLSNENHNNIIKSNGISS
jgi:hypothetical protein